MQSKQPDNSLKQQKTDSNPEIQSDIQKKPIKMTIACSLCREKHKYCSKDIPCERCKKYGVKCTYGKAKKRGRPKLWIGKVPNKGSKQTTFTLTIISDLTVKSKVTKRTVTRPQIPSIQSILTVENSFVRQPEILPPISEIFKNYTSSNIIHSSSSIMNTQLQQQTNVDNNITREVKYATQWSYYNSVNTG